MSAKADNTHSVPSRNERATAADNFADRFDRLAEGASETSKPLMIFTS
jgi:hypothetical protein